MIETRVIEKFKSAKKIMFITGAGISADSGIPTYRGIGGLYDGKLTEDGIPVEEALSGFYMETKPQLPWKYINQMRKVIASANPNGAHKVIGKMQEIYDRILVLTQNVDRYHQDGGCKNVIDIHGDIWLDKCMSCDYHGEADRDSFDNNLPRCPKCGDGILRPDVVLFGEMLDSRKLMRLRMESSEGYDIICAIGTTAVFPYIQEPILMANDMNIFTIEINPTNSFLTKYVNAKISLRAEEAMKSIWEIVNS